jgi:hypothetical protein
MPKPKKQNEISRSRAPVRDADTPTIDPTKSQPTPDDDHDPEEDAWIRVAGLHLTDEEFLGFSCGFLHQAAELIIKADPNASDKAIEAGMKFAGSVVIGSVSGQVEDASPEQVKDLVRCLIGVFLTANHNKILADAKRQAKRRARKEKETVQ